MKTTAKHISFILDGNRRWATEKGLPKTLGHTEGGKTLKKILSIANNYKIPYVTTWVLSTENLKRSEKELKHLFSIIEKLVDYINDVNKKNIKVNTIGDLSLLPEKTKQKLEDFKELTKNNTGMVWTLAVAYGGHDEIIRTTKKIIEQNIQPDDIDEKLFSSLLDTHDLPDIDLVIRTGGRTRLSGFLPWQTTYAEMYFTPTYWPAFDKKEFDIALDWFENQKRTFGI